MWLWSATALYLLWCHVLARYLTSSFVWPTDFTEAASWKYSLCRYYFLVTLCWRTEAFLLSLVPPPPLLLLPLHLVFALCFGVYFRLSTSTSIITRHRSISFLDLLGRWPSHLYGTLFPSFVQVCFEAQWTSSLLQKYEFLTFVCSCLFVPYRASCSFRLPSSPCACFTRVRLTLASWTMWCECTFQLCSLQGCEAPC